MEVFTRHSTSSLHKIFLPNIIQYDKYCTLIIFGIGIITNILTSIVLWYPKMRTKQSSVITLLALSINDIFCLMLAILDDAEKVWEVQLFKVTLSCKIFRVLLKSSKLFSMMLLLTAIMQHYNAMNNYYLFDYYKKKKWLILIIIIEFILSILILIPEGHYADLIKLKIQFNECQYQNDVWLLDGFKSYYWLVEFVLWALLTFSISGLSVLILHKDEFNDDKSNFLHRTDCKLSKQKHCSCLVKDINEQNLRLSRTLIVCGFYLVFTNIPMLIMTCIKPLNYPGDIKMQDFEVKEDPVWNQYFSIKGSRIIFSELQLTQYCIRFLIYVITNFHFRQYLSEIFGYIRSSNMAIEKRRKQRSQIIKDRKYLLQKEHHTDSIINSEKSSEIEMKPVKLRKPRKNREIPRRTCKSDDESGIYLRSSNRNQRSSSNPKQRRRKPRLIKEIPNGTIQKELSNESITPVNIKKPINMNQQNPNIPIIPLYYSIPRPNKVELKPEYTRPWLLRNKYHSVSTEVENYSSFDDDDNSDSDDSCCCCGSSYDSSSCVESNIPITKYVNKSSSRSRSKSPSPFIVYLDRCDCNTSEQCK